MTKRTTATRPAKVATDAAALIDARIDELGDWRGATLARVRTLIREASPDIVEEWKWSVPVWSQGGIICTGEAYKKAVKLTFANGAALKDPANLFNASLDGGTRRAIDLHEGDAVNARALKALVRAAVAFNRAAKAPARPAKSPSSTVQPRLLSGGNPQIAKAEGDAPVQAYIAALPGWKREVGRRLDALIVRACPRVRKAVKWNSPLYGVEGQGWFLGMHVFTKYVKLAFFRGSELQPLPPGASKSKETRYLDIRENDVIDERQLTSWIKQAAALPGWTP